MSIKLLTIGDSISQGFMSGAAARTDLSYSTLIAKKLKLTSYAYPTWESGGMPLNIEDVLRALNKRYGSNIRALEWLTLLPTVNKVLDACEFYYERGLGRADQPYPNNVPFFHNVAIRGFDMADSWKVTPQIAWDNIQSPRRKRDSGDGFLGTPDESFYRTTLRVLNPPLTRSETGDFTTNYSQIDWLDYHVENGGVENLCLWLGAWGK